MSLSTNDRREIAQIARDEIAAAAAAAEATAAEDAETGGDSAAAGAPVAFGHISEGG